MMNKLLSGMAGAALAFTSHSTLAQENSQPEIITVEALPYHLSEATPLSHGEGLGLKDINLACLKFINAISNFALTITFDIPNNEPNNIVEDQPSQGTGVTLSKINLISVFYDASEQGFRAVDCNGLTFIRDIHLNLIARTAEPIITKYANDLISELDKAALALKCEHYTGLKI